jgi:hypothetical protein
MASPLDTYESPKKSPLDDYQSSQAAGTSSPDSSSPKAGIVDRTMRDIEQLRPLPIPQGKEQWQDRAHTAAGLLPMMLAPETALGRIGIGAVSGAAQNAADRNDARPMAEKAGWGAVRGGSLATGGELVAKGGNKLADWLMQKAVGMKKFLPGAGNTLVDEGMWGTKNMMANQVGPKLDAAEEALQSAAGSLPGKADPKELANNMFARGQQRFVTPDSGSTSPLVQGDLDKVIDIASQTEKLPLQSGRDLVSIKRQGDWGGYTASGTPATALDSELGRMQGDWARSKLGDMSQGLETTVPDILKREQALTLAKKGLTRPDSLSSNPISGAAFSRWPGSSLVQSLGAQGTQKTLGNANNGVLQQILRNLTQ